MSTFKSKKDSARRGTISSAKLLSTSALTAGVLALAMSPARADDVTVPDVSIPETPSIETPTTPETPAADPASWTGFTDEEGSITVETPNDTLTNITQNTSLYVGTSSNLDIPEGYHVNIDQASTNWLFVAKAAPDADPTYILGRLTADGRVIIIDRNGVFTGANSSIDVAGIVATTGDVDITELKESDLKNLKVSNIDSGKIELNGTVTVANAGLAAFVAPTVVNNGVINAKMGKVVLASGREVTLDLYGDKLMEIAVPGNQVDAILENNGSIHAEDGIVQITAEQAKDVVDHIINNTGLIDVSSATQVGGKIVLSGGGSGKVTTSGKLDASGKTGGEIEVTGQFVSAEGNAVLDASGVNDGGTIHFGGDWQGQGDTPTSEYAFVGQNAILNANSEEEGDGGEVVVWSDKATGFFGLITSRGGANGGNGGRIETSSAGYLEAYGIGDASAANGNAGEWLLDPDNLTVIAGAAGVYTDANGILNDSVGDAALDLLVRSDGNPTNSTVTNGTIQNSLNAGTSVVLRTRHLGSEEGDINVNATITKSGGGNAILRMEAHDDININQAISSIAGHLAVELVAGNDIGVVPGIGDNNINILANINTNGGHFTANADNQFNTGGDFAIETNGGAVNVNAVGDIALDGSIYTNGGVANFTGANFTLDDPGVDTIDTNGGNVTVNAGYVRVSGTIDASNGGTGGAIAINNTGIFDTKKFGVPTFDTLRTSGTGTITLNQKAGGSIQEAVNAIQNTGTGLNTINVGAGTFEEQVVVAENNFLIKGANAGNTANGPRGAETIIRSPVNLATGYLTNKAIVTVLNADNVTFDGIEVDGAGRGNANYRFQGFGYYNSSGAIRNSIVHGITETPFNGNQHGNAIYALTDSGSGNLDVTNNYVYDFQKNGITLNGVGQSGTVSGNVVEGEGAITTTAQNGIQVGYGANANVIGNFISQIGYTPSAWSASSILVFDAGNNVVIDNNHIQGTAVDIGVAVVSTDNTQVTNNLIENSGIGVSLDGGDYEPYISWGVLGGSSNNNVSGNTIRDSASNAVSAYHVNALKVDNNIIHDTGADAIDVTGGSNIKVRGNAIGYTDLAATTSGGNDNIHGDGIKVDGASDVVIKGNNVTETAFTVGDANGADGNAIQVINSNGVVIGGALPGEGNKLTNTVNGDGVRLQNNNNVEVRNNTIDNVGRVGIWGGNINTATISGNKVTHDNLAGYGSIHADGGSNWTVSGNTIGNKFPDNNSAGDIGIFLNGVGGTNAITGNTVDSTSSDGIRTQNTGNLTISGNFVGDSSIIGGDGIDVSNSAGVQITNNWVANTTLNGIILTDGDNATISGNQVEGADQDGIAVVSSDDVQILNNDLGHLAVIYGQPNVGDSISVTGSDDATISGNDIRNAGTNGVHLDGATDVTITNNQILDSAQIGLLVENGSTVAALTGNTFNGTPTYIENRVAGTNIFAGNNFFKTLTEWNTANPGDTNGFNPLLDIVDPNNFQADEIAALFELEDKTDHVMDNATYGKVTYVDNNLFVTGNTLGIQAGVDAADIGDTINVNDDTFVENVLIDKNNLKLRGFGTTVQYDIANDGPGRGPAGAVFTVTADNVNIDPFAFDGLGIANYGINANGADNLIVDGNSFVNFILTNINIDNSSNVRIFGNTTTGAQKGVHANNSPDVWVYSNTINGATVAGVHISNTSGADYFSDADVWNNEINSGANAVGVLVDNSNYVTVGAHLTNQPDLDDALNGNVITGGLRGVVVNNSNNAMVRYNHVSNTASDTIQVNNGTGVQVLNNTLSNIGWDGVQFNASTNGLIKDNSITNITGASGIAVMYGSNGTVVDNNTINGADRLGIYTWNSDGLQIKNNKITDTGREGGNNWFLSAIHLEGVDNSTIDNNNIDSSNGSGIRVGGAGNQAAQTTSGNVITRNTIKNVDQDGIRVSDSNSVKINNNYIGFTEATPETVWVSAGIDNIIGDGIVIINSDGTAGNKTEVNGNLVFGTATPAFDKGSSIQVLNSDHVNILNNSLYASKWDYIRLDAEGGSISNLLVQGNIGSLGADRVGIYAEGLTNSTINQNTIADTNRYGGIYTFGGSNFNITNNNIDRSDETGILVKNGGGVINVTGNLIDTTGLDKKASDGENSGDGIRIVDTPGSAGFVTGVKVANNQVGLTGGTDNINGNGVSVINSAYTQVLTNQVQQTTGHGIHLNPSPNSLVQGNDIKNVDGHGINVSAGNNNVKVDDNDITGAGLDGIHAELSNDIEITKNKIYADGILTNGANGYGIFLQNGLSALVKDNEILGGNATNNNAGKKGAGLDGIFANNSDGIEIDNNTIRGGNAANGGNANGDGGSGAGGHGIYIQLSQQARITNNDILSGSSGGNGSSRTRGMGAEKSGIYAVNNAGISAAGYRDGIFIDSNIIDSSTSSVLAVGDDGIYVENSGRFNAGANNAKVTNNTVRDTGEDGIDVRGTNGAQILNNTVENVAEHGIRLNPSHNAVIDNNTINNTGIDGIHVLDSNNVDVTNNDLHTLGNHGIYASNSNDLYVFNNVIGNGTNGGADVDGIHVSGGRNAEIDQNLIQGGTLFRAGAGNDGIHVVNNREAVITDNIIKGGPTSLFIIPGGVGAVRHGIYAENSGAIIGGGLDAIFGQFRDGVRITGNQVLNNGLALGAGVDGIHVLNSAGGLLGGRALVENNTVRGVGDDGIFVDNTDGIQVLDNMVSLALNDGIRVENSDIVEIIDNNVSAVGEDGIELLNSNIFDISHNIVNLTGANGILATNATLGTIDNNSVTLAGEDGISLVTGNLVEIDQNTVTLSGDDGISVVDSNAVAITDNNVSLSADHGIFVDPSFFIDIIGNVVTLSGTDGIHAEDTFVLNIQNNDVTLSGDDGIDVSNSGLVDISGNTVALSGDDGITATNVAGLDIHNNIVALSGDDGIDVDSALLFNISDNVVALSGDNGIELSNALLGGVDGNLVVLSGDDGIEGENLGFVDINGNFVLLSGGDGIDINNTLFTDVTGNAVILSANNGIESSNNLFGDIAGNFVLLSGDDGINLDGGLFTNVIGNIVTLSGDDGIDTDDTLFNTTAGNIVTLSGDNGIEASDDLFGTVAGNIVTLSGDDGINLDGGLFTNVIGNIVTLSGDDGIDVDDSLFANVQGNIVTLSADNGIEVTDSPFVDISGNVVLLSGNDGINVDNSLFADITNNFVAFAFGDGIDVDDSFGADIYNNLVTFVAGNGIEVSDSAFSDIIGNLVMFTAGNGIDVDDSFAADIASNGVLFTLGDGIHVEDSNFVDIDNNFIRFTLGDGIDLEDSFGSEITDNDVRFALGSGIEVEDSAFITIDNNVVEDAAVGIFVDPSSNITISNNDISHTLIGVYLQDVSDVFVLNNTIHENLVGLYTEGNNGYIKVAGNLFEDNFFAGAVFRSGAIDISDVGNPNTFRNTNPFATPVGMVFDGSPTELTIVNETLGTTIFEGFTNPGSYYVYFTDGSILTPSGEVIVIDGMNASFDGIVPSAPGFTPAQLAFIEDRLNDADDPLVNGRGQIFVGSFPTLGLDARKFFEEYDPFSAGVAGLNVTITGLPPLAGLPIGSPGISGLNQIAPAAGEETGANATTPAEFANIEPAAGGDNAAGQNVSCWGDAISAAGAGAAVNYSYGGTFEESIAAAASCNTAGVF